MEHARDQGRLGTCGVSYTGCDYWWQVEWRRRQVGHGRAHTGPSFSEENWGPVRVG